MEDSGLSVELTIEDFSDAFKTSEFNDAVKYADFLKKSLSVSKNEKIVSKDLNSLQILSSSDSSGDTEYYYNIGTTLNVQPNYNKYAICSEVQKGDIILDLRGSGEVFGHAAIVEGHVYSSTYGYYVRLVESIDQGVCRGLLDATRVDERKSYVYRVTNATNQQKRDAVDFCIGQIGKYWMINITHDYSPSGNFWMCSQLVWAGYKNQGIDIECNGGPGGEPGVTPMDITINSTAVTQIDIRTATQVLSGDFNSDGKTDILTIESMWDSNTMESAAIHFIVRTSEGSKFSSAISGYGTTNLDVSRTGKRYAVGDFNGDGYDDVVLLYDSDGTGKFQFLVFINQRNLTFVRYNWGSWSASVNSIGDRFIAGNFRGATKTINGVTNPVDDLAIMYQYADGRTMIFVWPSNGSNGFNANQVWYSWPANAYNATSEVRSRFVSGDFNGDGKADVAALYKYGSGRTNWFVQISSGNAFNGSANWRQWPAGSYDADSVTGRIAVGKINNDGRDDIAVMYEYANYAAKVLVYTPNSNKDGFNDRILQEWPTDSYVARAVTDRFVAGRFRGENHGETVARYKYTTNTKIWAYYTQQDNSHSTGIKAELNNHGNYVHHQWG